MLGRSPYRTAALVVGVALLATALVPAGSAPSQASADRETITWELLDCTYVYAQVPVRWSALEPYMPEGFEPSSPLVVRALTQAPEGTSLLSFEVDVCDQGTGLDGQQRDDMVYASIWVAAFPPDAVEPPRPGGTFVNFDVLIPDDDRRQVLQDAGLPAHDGEITIAWDGPEQPATPVTVDYELEGLGSFSFDLATAQDPRTFTSSFTQWTPTSDGHLARWSVDWTQTALYTGTGTIHLEPGSWVADVVGATEVPARGAAGQWSYTDGEILLP